MAITVDSWREHLTRTLRGYDEKLLRQVSLKLCKPRNQWPIDELIERDLATLDNPVTLDRRLKELPEPARRLLACLGHSRQPRWRVGSLIEIAYLLGDDDGVGTLRTLLDAGLVFPLLFPPGDTESKTRLRSFDQWLGQGSAPEVFVYPPIAQRSLTTKLPPLPAECVVAHSGPVLESDGLEWLLRVAVLWQQIVDAPLRRTQQRDFFKRDLDRLRGDPLLASPPSDALVEPPDPGLFAVALGLAMGLFRADDNQIVAEPWGEAWTSGLPSMLTAVWAALPLIGSWNAARGWQISSSPGNPYPAAYLAALVMLGELEASDWTKPAALEEWLLGRHPFWASARPPLDSVLGLSAFLLGVAYPLRLVQASKHPEHGTVVRLSPMGRAVLGFSDATLSPPSFPQTILVQPNLEILAYRQGLTPALIMQLSKLANWKTLGAACTLLFEPDSVYRALESGETFDSIVQTLDRHGMKPTPTSVLDSLRTWSNKRDRLTVYPSAALLEFPGATELNEALSRGLPAVRLTERLAVVASESQIDYRQFRLTGTRDYLLPPEKCVEIEDDGVTLSVDLGRSDLLLDTEMQRFAELDPSNGVPGRRLYRITPASLAQAKDKGVTIQSLEAWFQARTGLSASPAARLLMTGADAMPMEIRRQIVLHVASPDLAEGLAQWPQTRDLIQSRLGPTTLAVIEKHVAELTERLKSLGIKTRFEEM
jgi:hypothetical protein